MRIIAMVRSATAALRTPGVVAHRDPVPGRGLHVDPVVSDRRDRQYPQRPAGVEELRIGPIPAEVRLRTGEGGQELGAGRILAKREQVSRRPEPLIELGLDSGAPRLQITGAFTHVAFLYG